MNKARIFLCLLTLFVSGGLTAQDAPQPYDGDCCPAPYPICCPPRQQPYRCCTPRVFRTRCPRPRPCRTWRSRAGCKPKVVCCPQPRCCRPKPKCCPAPAPECPAPGCLGANKLEGDAKAGEPFDVDGAPEPEGEIAEPEEAEIA